MEYKIPEVDMQSQHISIAESRPDFDEKDKDLPKSYDKAFLIITVDEEPDT